MKFPYLFIVLLTTTAISTIHAQNWRSTPAINPAINFTGVCFPNDHGGYVVGNGGTIYKTIDGGLTWALLTSGTTEALNDVHFNTMLLGLAVGANGTIRRTTNAGNAWAGVTVSGTATTSFNEVQFVNANNAYIVGSGGKAIKSVDGGVNWTTLTTGTTNDVLGVHFTTVNIGYLCGTAGLIKKTTNGGTSWATQTIATTENINDVFFIDDNNGFAAADHGEIWRTTDGGTTWVLKNSGLGTIDNLSIGFADLNNGTSTSTAGNFYVTINKGDNWINYKLQGYSRLSDVWYSSTYTGYAVGDNGLVAKYQSELEPEIQPSNVTFTEVYTTSLKVNYDPSPDLPTGYIAVRKAGSAPTTDPLDGIVYTVGQALGDGVIAYVGGATSFNETALLSGTNYYYKIYAYNGAGVAINYKPGTPLVGNRSTYATGTPWTKALDLSGSFPEDVHFFNANNGGIAGGYNLKTTGNGGQSWIEGFEGNGDGYHGIFFTSATTAYTVGSASGPIHMIRRTVNGGTTWVDQLRATSTSGLLDVWFTNSITGFVVGDNGIILRTTNGTTWSPVTSPTTNSLLSVMFPSPTVGFAVGDNGTIIRTTNGGTTWTTVTSGVTSTLSSVHFTDTNTGYAAGVGGVILKTINGGTSWSPQTSGTTQNLNSICFTDSNTGYVVGASGTIRKTSTGGASWYAFDSGAGTSDFRGVFFPTPYTGYAVGYLGLAGVVMKFSSVPAPTSQPTGLNVSAITSTGLTLSWTPPAQPTDAYLVLRKIGSLPTGTPLDGVTYSGGATVGDGTVAYAGPATSFNETALAPGTNYYYRVYAYNRSEFDESANYLLTTPLSGSTTTTLTAPTATSAASFSGTGFTANWSAVAGASGYAIDVSPDGFSTFVSGYNNLPVSGTSSIVTGLTPGTSYSYRVRAINVSGASVNSNTVSALTLAPAVATSPSSSITINGFIASWTPSQSATGYYFDLSSNNFSTFVGSYNNFFLTGTSLSITGLSAGTTYQYRVRASNGSGPSANSSVVNTITLCAAPTANSASSTTASGFVANWQTVPGVTDYRIDIASDPSFNFFVGTYINQTVAGTSLAVTGLSAGTSYYYRVRASNASGSSANSNAISVLTLPSPPVPMEAISVTSSSFVASWNPVATATSYALDVSLSNAFSTFIPGYNAASVATTSATVTVPTEGLTYYYRVRAINATGASTNSIMVDTELRPAEPVAAAAGSITTDSFLASWSAASGASSYTIEVSSDNFVTNIVGYRNLAVSGTSVAVVNLTEGTTYKYRVRGVNASWNSTVSNAISATTIPPAPVANSPVSIATTSFTAKWAAAGGASGYQLDVSADNFSTFVSGFNNMAVGGTSASVSGLTAGQTYQYRVRALNSSGTSQNSNIVAVSTLTIAPVANNATSVTSTGFTATWSPVTGASDYRIDVSASNTYSSFEGIYNNLTVSGTSLNVTNLSTPGITYYYRIRANNSSGASANSNSIQTLLKPPAPVATAATAISTSGFTANWNTVAGASGYRLDVSLNDFVSNLPGFSDLAVAATSRAVTGLNPGTTYKFRVRALNATGASDNSGTVTTVTVPPSPTPLSASAVSTNGFTANWATTAGITAYFLDVSADPSFATFLAGFNDFSTSGSSQAISGLSAGTLYYYRVRSANASGTSANSASISTITVPVAPIASGATALAATGFTVNWAAASGASDYRLDISTDSEFSSFVGSFFNQTVSGTSVAISGLQSGTRYYYRLRSANASGSSINSNVINTLTLPGAPVAIDALSVTSSSFNATWIAVPTATSYFIDVSTQSNFSSFVGTYNNLSVATTSLSITVPTPGTSYYYRVRAVNGSGTSASSNVITTLMRPAAPTPLAATAITAGGFTANWSAASGATGYYLDVSSNNFVTMVSPYDNYLLAGTSVAISGLQSGTAYQYRVRAYNASGSSASSPTTNVVTIPPSPVATNSTSFTTTSFTANWQPAPGATSYKIDVASSDSFGIGTLVTGFNDLTVNGTSVSVTGLSSGTLYYYRIRAVNAAGTSPNSNVVSSTNIPLSPAGLFASDITTSSFAANWSSTAGALGYYLDVSSTNFSSFVAGYNNLSVPTSGVNVSGLLPGTTYQFRVRASNASGNSVSSTPLTLATLPTEPTAQPTSISFSDITTTSIRLVYSGSTGGATGYIVIRKGGSAPSGAPVDGISYTAGNTLGDAAIIYVGHELFALDEGLLPGNTYFYQVFAFNGTGAGINYLTTNPLAASQVTIAGAPELNTASAINQSGFTANWTPAPGAADYELDVSSDNFITLVPGLDKVLTGNVTSFIVTGLKGGTVYQYRLRARNAAGVSLYSMAAQVLTIPDTPTDLLASSITPTSFAVSWKPVSGQDNYFVDLATDINFTILVVTNASTSAASIPFTGLGNLTKYYVRIRASNASGDSPSSTILAVTTLAGGSGPAPLTLGTPAYSATMKTAAFPVTISASGGTDPKTVLIHYRSITSTSFQIAEAAQKSGTTFEVQAQPAWADELGLEFYFSATDNGGQSTESTQHYFVYKSIDATSNQNIPFEEASFDGKASSYRMFSVPFELSDNNIVNLFEPALNGFDNTRWRLLHYSGGSYIEYPDQLKKIEPGKGYWFNTIEPDFAIKLGTATVTQATSTAPFQMVVEQGWNQIGDPYPFNIDWNTVKNANPDVGLNSIWTFDAGSFSKKEVLAVWNGAFVFSETAGTITIPLGSKTSAARKQSGSTNLGPGEWLLPMTLDLGGLTSEFAVGMRNNGKESKDRFDEIAVPRFMNYVEMSSFHPEYFAHEFSTDVVAPSMQYEWELYLHTNADEKSGTIRWNRDALAHVPGSVLMFDKHNQVLINMKVTDTYTMGIHEGQSIKIIVGNHENLPDATSLSRAYPNPFSRSFSIPVFLEQNGSRVQVELFDAVGKSIATLESDFDDAGYHELYWNLSEKDLPLGLMLYRVTIDGIPGTVRRIVKVN